MSNFSFGNNVIQSRLLLLCQNASTVTLSEQGLNHEIEKDNHIWKFGNIMRKGEIALLFPFLKKFANVKGSTTYYTAE